VLPGTFNPPTRAHFALANAALREVDELLLVLPRSFPHKSYKGIDFAQRLRLLEAAAGTAPRISIAATDQGLFLDIYRECRQAYGPGVRLSFVCGRDAAERILTWDYGQPSAVHDMLNAFDLLVAARRGRFDPPAEFEGQIRALLLPESVEDVSATEVRTRIARGEPWEHLVPAEIVPLVSEIYAQRNLLEA